MSDFIVSHLNKSQADKQLFSDLSFIIHPLDRIGLLGINGAGKTSLLDCLAGKSSFDGDKNPFSVAGNFKINYLTQEPDFKAENTILESVLDNSLEQARAVKNYEFLLSSLEKNPEDKRLQEKLITAEAEMTTLNAWMIESEVKIILTQLGLPNFFTLISSLSGGQKRRVQLAQALVNPSDLLLLDEPTNHLDVELIEWLQKYLTSTKKTLLFVTHDRYFLDQISTRIFELENGQLYQYKGNYEAYLLEKAQREEQERSSQRKAEKMYQSELVWIRKSPQARTTKQQARIDRFDDLSEKVKVKKQEEDLQINLVSQRLGKKVIEFQNASFAFQEK
ncbi:MAG: ABC-F family ATP-binding cassette domain-containing protein, partial [Lactovum sp.]